MMPNEQIEESELEPSSNDDGGPAFFAPRADLEARAAAARTQMEAIIELSDRFGKGFTVLSQAIEYGRKTARNEKRLTDEERDHYVEINDRANAAKHEGLGAIGAAEISRFGDQSTRLAGVVNLGDGTPAQRMIGAGAGSAGAGGPFPSAAEDQAAPFGDNHTNRIGRLENVLSKYLGRPLVQNEPRYKWAPRPQNKGPFTAIVDLHELRAPVPEELQFKIMGEEFPGALKWKQAAKHSAALQTILYLEALGIRSGAPPSGSGRRASGAQGGGDSSSAPRSTSVSRAEAEPQEPRQPPTDAPAARTSTAASVVVDCGGTSTAASSAPSRTAVQPAKSAMMERLVDVDRELVFEMERLAIAEPAPLRAVEPEEAGGTTLAVKEPQPPIHSPLGAGVTPVRPSTTSTAPPEMALPDLDAIVAALQTHGSLKTRELYLWALGLDPRTNQMGSGVRKVFERFMTELQSTEERLLSEGAGKAKLWWLR